MGDARVLLIQRAGASADVFSKPEPDFREPVCLYVHGYNADSAAAVEQFARLRRTVARSARLPHLLEFQTWTVLWPGFAQVGFRYQKWSALTYSDQIGTAREAARALAEYLLARVSPTSSRVVFLAHSLGCRLALETLSHLHGRWPSDALPTAILMAAAVPLDLLWRGLPLRAAAELPRQTFVLYSQVDDVLQAPFMFGQTIARDGGILPQAVGATGAPLELWSESVETSNDHSSYFDDDISGRAVARALGAGVAWPPGDRSTSERHLLETPGTDERGLPAGKRP